MDNKQRLQRIQNRIAGKKELNFIDSWHYLMLNYGWINFEEFKKMDAHVVGELIERCNKMNQEQNRQTRRMK